ncbi:MAG: carotenoid oxygenase family protein [Acidimicrobiales bacterium]|nr:carotenoid oxygenase family protein [Acidimicrobiales bacterium]
MRERQLDDALVEFPRVDDRRICSGARYGYFAELGASHRTLKAEALLKYDLASGARQRVSLPSGWYANEPCFAPRSEGSAEDDGWILSYVTDEASGGAELWVLDASSFDPEPVARVILPQRKPQGFHTRWVPAPPAG